MTTRAHHPPRFREKSISLALQVRRQLSLTLTLVALTSTLIGGCAGKQPVPRPAAPEQLPTVFEIDSLLTERRNALRSVRALARLQYRHPDGSSSSREAIAISRPDRMRVEVLSLFGAVFVLTAQDGRFIAYARQENTVYQGTASPENMWRYARIGLPVVDLVDLVLGTPPQRTEVWSHVSFDEESGWVQLSQELQGGIQAVWLEGNLPQAAEYRDEFGDVQWRAYFSEYRSIGSVPIATHIRLEVPDAEHSVEIALSDIDVNPELDPSIFRVEAPAGARVVELR